MTTLRKIEEASLYVLGETSLLLSGLKNGDDMKKDFKRFTSKMKNIPYETLEEVRSLGYTAEDYAFGAYMRSVYKSHQNEFSDEISKREVLAAQKFDKFLNKTAMNHVVLSPDNNSYFYHYDKKIYLGCNIAPLKSILRKSSLFDILMMTYLHEEGHRQDKLSVKRLKEIEGIIKKYGRDEYRKTKSGVVLNVVRVPDNTFKKICKEAIRSEMTAWKYAELASSQFDLNKNDLYAYKAWALYNYASAHHSRMRRREVVLLDYVFISE